MCPARGDKKKALAGKSCRVTPSPPMNSEQIMEVGGGIRGLGEKDCRLVPGQLLGSGLSLFYVVFF